MSGHGHHDADAGPHQAHDDHHETSSDDFPADEPRSPAWLPLLGGALLLAGIFAFVILDADPSTDVTATPEAAAAPAARPAALPAQRPATGIRPGMAPPPAPGQPARRPAP